MIVAPSAIAVALRVMFVEGGIKMVPSGGFVIVTVGKLRILIVTGLLSAFEPRLSMTSAVNVLLPGIIGIQLT